jgi:ABC-type branched-subunit amino acid transport system substrate-binding protein
MNRRLLAALCAVTLASAGCAARGEPQTIVLNGSGLPIAAAPASGNDTTFDETTAPALDVTGSASDPAAAPTTGTTPAGGGSGTPATAASRALPSAQTARGAAPSANRPAGPAAARPAGAEPAPGAAPRPGAPAPAPAPGAAVPGGGDIVVGGIFPLSGPLSLIGKPGSQAAAAVFRSVNDAGGINGRKIKFIFYDDRAEPDRTLAVARRLVEQDKALVLGPSLTIYSPNLIPYTDEVQIPFVGYEGLLPEAYYSKYVIGAMGSLRVMSHGVLNTWMDQQDAKGVPTKRIGVVFEDVPPAHTHNDDIEKHICPARDCQVVRKEPVTVNTSDFASILTKMRLDNVDGVWLNASPPIAAKLLLTARSMNYKPPAGYVGHQGTYGHPVVVESCGSFCNGTLGGSTLLPVESDAPPIAEMRNLVQRYYSDWEDDVLYGEVPYIGALSLVDLLRETLSRGELSRATLLATAATMRNWDAHGFTAAPISMAPPLGDSFNPFCYVVEMKDGKWVQAGNPVDVTKLKSWPYGPKA